MYLAGGDREFILRSGAEMLEYVFMNVVESVYRRCDTGAGGKWRRRAVDTILADNNLQLTTTHLSVGQCLFMDAEKAYKGPVTGLYVTITNMLVCYNN